MHVIISGAFYKEKSTVRLKNVYHRNINGQNKIKEQNRKLNVRIQVFLANE